MLTCLFLCFKFLRLQFSSAPPGRSNLMHQTGGQWTMASNRGPSAIGSPQNAVTNDSSYYKSRDAAGSGLSWAQNNSGSGGNAMLSGGVGGSWGAASAPSHQATPSITVNTMPAGVGAGVSGGAGTGVSDGSYEKQLVMELCPPGGMKPEPPPDKLAQFSRSVASLNPDYVCPVLLDCIEEGQPWIIRAKALCVMEACIKFGQKPGAPNNAYADFLHACNGEFAPLANHNRAAVRDPAKRVLGLLGVAVPVAGGAVMSPVAGAPPAAAPPAPPPAPVANLLDFDTPAPAPAAPPPPAAAASGGGSLFGGLSMAAAPAPAAAAPVAAAPAPTPASDNLLDLMAPAPAAAAPAPAPSSFGFMNTTAAVPAAEPAPAPAAPADMFGNLSINEPAPAASPTAAPASAFGFMNSPTPAAEPAAAAATNAASTPTADSFDPLKNATPNTQKKMMQVSQEQMQAMMYQQMMMQQQMQMAQMQMAMQKAGNPQMFMAMPGQVMRNPAASKSTFAFMEKPKKEDDHSFDFVKDAMKSSK